MNATALIATTPRKGQLPQYRWNWQRWPHTRYRGDVRARSNERAKIAFAKQLRRQCGLDVKPEHIIVCQLSLDPLNVELAVSRIAGYEYPGKISSAECHWPLEVEDPTSVTLSFGIISDDVSDADTTLETFLTHVENITGWQVTDMTYTSRHSTVQWVQVLAERPRPQEVRA